MSDKPVAREDVDAILRAAGRGDFHREDVQAALERLIARRVASAVDRFLGWQLPDDFAPDCYIRFDRESCEPGAMWPVGTNLLTAEQAEHMLRFVFATVKD